MRLANSSLVSLLNGISELGAISNIDDVYNDYVLKPKICSNIDYRAYSVGLTTNCRISIDKSKLFSRKANVLSFINIYFVLNDY